MKGNPDPDEEDQIQQWVSRFTRLEKVPSLETRGKGGKQGGTALARGAAKISYIIFDHM